MAIGRLNTTSLKIARYLNRETCLTPLRQRAREVHLVTYRMVPYPPCSSLSDKESRSTGRIQLDRGSQRDLTFCKNLGDYDAQDYRQDALLLVIFQQPRCAPGYVGEGCATCDKGHAMEDGSVLSCGLA